MGFNFQSLPKEGKSNLVQAGIHEFTIESYEIKDSSTGSRMLVTKNAVAEQPKLQITDRYVVTDSKGADVAYGQYKLRQLMIATNTIPEGDFTLEVIARMLLKKKFKAELIEEEYNGKINLQFGNPETYEPIDEAVTSTPEATMSTSEKGLVVDDEI